MNSIHDIFKQFCKERHEEDKLLNNSKNFNYLQEVYANTELFDISLYNQDNDNPPKVKVDYFLDSKKAKVDDLKDFALPFENNFVKVHEYAYIAMREYAPNIITGTIFLYDTVGFWEIKNVSFRTNLPFTITLENDTLNISLASENLDIFLHLKHYHSKANVREKLISKWEESEEKEILKFLKDIIITCFTLNNLSKKAVVSDTPTTTKYEYYRRKNDTTIKKPVKPIYYVLDKKEETTKHRYNSIRAIGKLEFNHSFKVRGHYRHLNPKKKGHDRNGKEILGFTWVHEYVKGEGELVKKLRVIK